MTLKLFPSAKIELDVLNEKSHTIEQKIIESQYRFFTDTSGLRPFLDALNQRDGDDVVAYLSLLANPV